MTVPGRRITPGHADAGDHLCPPGPRFGSDVLARLPGLSAHLPRFGCTQLRPGRHWDGGGLHRMGDLRPGWVALRPRPAGGCRHLSLARSTHSPAGDAPATTGLPAGADRGDARSAGHAPSRRGRQVRVDSQVRAEFVADHSHPPRRRREGVGRPSHPVAHCRRADGSTVGAVSLYPFWNWHHRGGRESAGSCVAGVVTGRHRHRQLVPGIGAGGTGRHPDHTYRHAPGDRADQPGAGRLGRGVGGVVPVVPHCLRGLSGDRDPGDRTNPLRHPAGPGPIGAVYRDRRRHGGEGPGSSSAGLLPTASPIRWQRPDPTGPGVGGGRRRRRAPALYLHQLDCRHHHLLGDRADPAVDCRGDRLRRPTVPRPVRHRRLRGMGRGPPGRLAGPAVPRRSGRRDRRHHPPRRRLHVAGGAAPAVSTSRSSPSASAPPWN